MNQLWRNAHRLSSALRQCKTLAVVPLTTSARRISPISSWGQSPSLSLFSTKQFSTCSLQSQSQSAATEEAAAEDQYVPSQLLKDVFKMMEAKTKEEIKEDFFMMNRFKLYRMWKGPTEVKEYLQSKNILTEDEIKRTEKQKDDHDKFYEMYFRFENAEDYTELLNGLDRNGKNEEFFKFFKKWLKPEEEHML